MAQFLGRVKGSKGEATRLGGKSSGIDVDANGWNLGVNVWGHDVNGEDVFTILATGGSHGGRTQIIGELKRDADGEFVLVKPDGYVTVSVWDEAIQGVMA